MSTNPIDTRALREAKLRARMRKYAEEHRRERESSLVDDLIIRIAVVGFLVGVVALGVASARVAYLLAVTS